MKHKHHIIPRHAGGSDNPSNLVELTVAEHAEAHRLLFEQYGRKQDEIAWKSLSGIFEKEEIVQQLQSLGGKQGGPKSKGRKHPPRSEATRKLLRDKQWSKNPEIADEVRKKLAVASTGKFGDKNGFFGKHHNAETLEKLSGPRPSSMGDKNSQFGTCWITNGVENKKIKKEELENFISLGYTKGRKTK